MIVSHRHRFVFFAVPRTATHSLRQALRPVLAADDWEQQALSGGQRLPVPALARLGHGHVTAAQARAHLPEALWRDYFRFAFVRNPYTRFLSACHFLNRGNADYRGREREVIARLIRRPAFRRRVLLRPQAELLCDDRGRHAMHFVGRYENLAGDFARLCRTLGLPEHEPGRGNASPPVPVAQVLDDRLVAWVEDFYAEDFERFGYPTGPVPDAATPADGHGRTAPAGGQGACG